MKKFLQSFLFLLLFGAGVGSQGYSQCVPDPTLTVQGIYPDTLVWGCQFSFYTDTIDFVFPADTSVAIPFPPFSITVPFDSFQVEAVNFIPAGLAFTCNVPSCTYIPPGGGAPAKGCVSISGTPTVTTTPLDSIDVVGRAWVTILGAPTSFLDTIRMALIVNAPGTGGCAVAIEDHLSRALNVQVSPNPLENSSVISYKLNVTSEVNISVFDMYGRKISTLQSGKQAIGNYSLAISPNNGLPTGVYYVRFDLNNGSFVHTEKVISVQ